MSETICIARFKCMEKCPYQSLHIWGTAIVASIEGKQGYVF